MSAPPNAACASSTLRRDLSTFKLSNVQTLLGSIPFIFIQFRTLLRPPNSQPPSFQSFPHSLHKTPGGGGIPGSRAFRDVKTFKRATFKRSLSPLECAVEHPKKDASPEGVSR